MTVPSVADYLRAGLGTELVVRSDYSLDMNLGVRTCILGEGLKESGACFECPPGTFLLVAPTEKTDCNICPQEKAYCTGGKKIGPKPGYWRESNVTADFIQCINADACLGMDIDKPEDFPGNAVGRCDLNNGYHGVLCSSCLPTYKRSGANSCQACYKYEGLWLACILLLVIVGFTLMVRAVLASSEREENPRSVFGKILLNHLQMISITASFDMNWPESVTYVFELAAPIKDLTNAIVSFDCFMDGRDLDAVLADPYSFETERSDIRVVYQKLLLYASMPISLAATAWLVWYFVGRFEKCCTSNTSSGGRSG